MDSKIFRKILLQGSLYAFASVTVLYLLIILLDLADQAGGVKLSITLAVLFAIFSVVLLAVYKSMYPKEKKDQSSMFKLFQLGIRVVILLLLGIGLWGIFEIFNRSDCGECAVFQAVGLGVIILWAVIFLSYFIWAVYYYNINYGLTDEDWKKIFEAKESKKNGDLYSEDILNREPISNPYGGKTFGLPEGTVRGMIAFTLLFGAISLLIVSFGMKNELDSSSMFWDQYEFFKTAFLMMIAFYFGSRSLEYLRPKGQPEPSRPGASPNGTNSGIAGGIGGTPTPGGFPEKDPMKPENEIVQRDNDSNDNTEHSSNIAQNTLAISSEDELSGEDVDPMKK